MVSFAYVYIHPFEDGNGRIHRFLIHDILVRDGVVPNSTIIPVSAQILAHIDEYDTTLELFSKLIERKVKYDINDSGEMTVNNSSEIEALYRFPDLSNHTVFLARALQSTINKDVPEELLFLQCYDELKGDIQMLYLTRWDIEVSIREIKTIMDINILRSKTPEMLKKEVNIENTNNYIVILVPLYLRGRKLPGVCI